jgi:alpha-L-rhamnosidase
MKVARLQVNHIQNPLGFDLGERPTFSWVVEDASGKAAEASRVQVTRGGQTVLDTGWADLDAKACALDVPLAPRTRYEWCVSVRSDAGEEATSETAWFETAKMDEPWQAQWLTCDNDDPRHPIFSKTLALTSKELASARLYLVGLGLYEASIDGHKLGDEYLAPGTHAFDKWIQYQTYDVTEQLRDGAELSVALGRGWYSGRFGFVKTDTGYYGNDWRLIAELHLSYADGTEQVIATDDSWQVTRGTVNFSNIYDGEHRDDTLPQTEPVPAALEGAQTAAEATAKLHDRISLPVTAHETLTPTIISTPAGECVLDLGQNISGTFSLHGQWPRGTKVRVQTSELLQDGNFYRDNLRTALSEYVYVSDGNEHTLRPLFTFYGYRYAKIEVDGVAPESFDPTDFVGIVLHSDFDPNRGRITTGNPKVNQLISNARWSMRDNFVDTATDCPQRDERMGWTGDANVFSKTALLMAAPYAFYRKYLFDMALEQQAADGAMPMVVPSYGLLGAPAVWGDATTMIPWNMYQADGDPAILAEHYDAMKGWVDAVVAQDGDSHALLNSMQLADWLALDTKDPEGRIGYTDGPFIAYIYLWQSALIVGQTARVLGKSADAQRYEELAATTRAWIMDEYFTPTGRCAVNTMTAYALCVYFDLGRREWNVAQLRKMLQENNNHLLTGFVGTPILCPALSLSGLDREAYTLLLNEDYPSWLYCVNLGATTIWERWNSLDADGHITGIDMNSMNHYSYGAIVEWIANYAAGLMATTPGYATARIEPRVSWRLRSLDYTLDSAAGSYRVAWECVDEHHLRVQITVPFGATAEVVLPMASEAAYEALGGHVLGAGSYDVVYETTDELRRMPCVDWTAAKILDNREVANVVRKYVNGFDYAMATSDPSKTLRELQAEGLGQNKKMTLEELEACDAAMRELAD